MKGWRLFKQFKRWLHDRENTAGPNALLVHTAHESGAVVPLQICIQEGPGVVKCLVPSCDGFTKAIERAKEASIDLNMLRRNQDVLFSLELTEAQFLGDSIALAAAMGIYADVRRSPIDPYTAFTGNINLKGQTYRIFRNQWA